MAEQAESKNHYLTILICVSITIILIPICIYLYYYGSVMVTGDPEDLGVWGDFMNPWISLINAAILIFITFRVRDLDKKREKDKEASEKQREKDRAEEERKREIAKEEFENKRLQQTLKAQVAITKSQMRNQEVTEIVKILNSLNEMFQTNVDKENLHELKSNLTVIATHISSFRFGKEHLFNLHFNEKFDDEIYFPMVENLTDLINTNDIIVSVKNIYESRIMDEDYREEVFNKTFSGNETISFESNEHEDDFIDDIILREEKIELNKYIDKRNDLFITFNGLKESFTSGLYEFILK